MTDLADAPTSEPSPLSADPDEVRVSEAIDRLLKDVPPSSTEARTFLGAQFDAGLAWVHFDEGHGGLGVAPRLQKLVQERLGAAGAPFPLFYNPIGYGMGAPTVYTHGSDAQRDRYL